MRSRSEGGRAPLGRGAGVVRLALAALLLTAPATVAAEPLTFHLAARDALASVERYNAFLVSLGKRAKGVKVIQGGTAFAGQSCAGFGGVYRLGSIRVLAGPAALATRAPSRNGKAAIALAGVFAAAHVGTWTPPATNAESDLPFWTALPVSDGVQFSSDAALIGSGDAGLLGHDVGDGIVRFRADVAAPPDAMGRYRFLVELYGRTSSQDGALVAFGERRCFTFVDLAPVDLSVLRALVSATITNPTLLSALQTRLDAIADAIARRDTAAALDILAVFVQAVVSRSDPYEPGKPPPTVTLATAQRFTAAAFDVRRGLLFSPATAECGNGQRETGEACDGSDLGGLGCAHVGFQSGTLACSADCHFDTSQCVGAAVCGNGTLEAGEECDRGPENSDTLPDACRTTCKRSFCGDGVIDSFEDCEGKNLNDETCITLGYDGGSLRCDTEECELDDERCTEEE